MARARATIMPLLILLALAGPAAGLGAGLPRSTPEEQGVASKGLLEFVKAADESIDSMHSLMVVRHGKMVAEGWWAPYAAETRHSLFSLSKSFTSTAVGLAIAEGKLSVDDEVLKFFPEDAPADPSANLKSMRVSDLLRMSTGHATEPPRPAAGVWTKAFLAHPVPNKPGTHFLYNTSATYMLSAIVQKATGQTVLDYLRPRLFDPLGIEKPTWEASPQGISTGGYGLSIRTEDIAKFGLLYLNGGVWEGKKLIPKEWIEAATARQTSNGSNPASDWEQGYGYQFWRARHNAYRGDGAFGQYCLVLPEQDTVIAITSGTKDMPAVLSLVWDKILPAIRRTELSPDVESRTALESTLKSLSIRSVDGKGKPAKVASTPYRMAPNLAKIESVAVSGEASPTLTIKIDGVERSLGLVPGAWSPGRLGLGPLPESPVATAGGWAADGSLKAKVCFVETPFITTLTLKFEGDDVRLGIESNVGFGPTRFPELRGSTKAPAEAKAAEAGAGTLVPATPAQAPAPAPVQAPAPQRGAARFEKEIAAYEAADRTNPPPKGGVLFTGSSTIRLWKSLADDYPKHKVINRGFGGSEIADATALADRIIFPYEPKMIVLRAGGNDIHFGEPPNKVANDFKIFVSKVRSRLPRAEIVYVAVNPAPSRWGENDKYQALNAMIRKWAVEQPFVTVCDAYDVSLTPDGKPRPELFVDDMLHFNPDGYKVLAERVRPYLPFVK